MPLGITEVSRFLTDGFIRIENAFARSLADSARAILWRDIGCDAEDSDASIRRVCNLKDLSDGTAGFRNAPMTIA